jgi:hypothetical protein
MNEINFSILPAELDARSCVRAILRGTKFLLGGAA